MYTNFRLKVRDFFRKNRRLLFIILCLWVVVIFVNNFLRNNTFEEFQRTSFEEHTPIIEGEQVPEKLIEPINEIVDTYFNYCNTKNYEQAYNMLSNECKTIYFPDLETYKEYIDQVFFEDKIYYLQNFSNHEDVYIYRLRIMENLLATGLTGKEDLYVYEEKIAFKEEEDGSISLNIRQYIDTQQIEEVYEDEYMKIWVETKDVFYEQEVYTIKVANKTDNTIVLGDNQVSKEIVLNVFGKERVAEIDNSIVIYPDATMNFEIMFTKFFDEGIESESLQLNAVRVLPYYSGDESRYDFEIQNAERLYSIEIPF